MYVGLKQDKVWAAHADSGTKTIVIDKVTHLKLYRKGLRDAKQLRTNTALAEY